MRTPISAPENLERTPQPDLIEHLVVMTVKTKIPYRVKEQTLKAWLKKNIGKDDSGTPRWSYKVPSLQPQIIASH